MLHVIWPFDPGVPIGRIWPRWAHKRGVRLCATVCHPISSGHGGSSLDDLRQRTRHSGGLEVLRAADALLTTSLAVSRVLEKNLAIDPTRLHTVGWGTERQFVPVKPGENAPALAQASVPGLEPSFVLYPARGDGHDNVEALITAFARLPAPLRSSRQLVVTGHLPEPAASRLRDVADAEGVGDESSSRAPCPRRSHAPALPGEPSSCASRLSPTSTALPSQKRWRAALLRSCRTLASSKDQVSPGARFDPSSPTAISASIERGLYNEAFREAALQRALDSRVRRGQMSRTGRPRSTKHCWPDPCGRGAVVVGSR